VPPGDSQIPIFELPVVLLPSEQIPLHIFEERYKRMIGHCLERDEPFGIVLRTDDGVRSVGCAASVADVVEQFDDGRMNILVEGEFRFRITSRLQGEEFPLAEIERLGDEGAAATTADSQPAREAFERLLEIVGSDAELDEDAETAYEIAARVEIPLEAKQNLLESDSEPERLALLERLLERLGEQVRRSRKVAERARSNGHGPISGLGPPER
jgi:ATP-dependent Lon protease